MASLTGLEKWSYAVGNVPFSVKEAAFANFVVFYYTQVNGLSGSLAGLAMFFALTWDAISDPVVGSWSDNFRSRWGRRHPLLVAGALPTTALFLALFAPPQGMSEMGIFAWLLGVSILLRTTLTVYFVPYTAMGAELSTDYDQRTTIAKARVTLGWIAGMALPAIAFTFFFSTSEWNRRPAGGRKLLVLRHFVSRSRWGNSLDLYYGHPIGDSLVTGGCSQSTFQMD